jgi:chromosomal replication initiator protein
VPTEPVLDWERVLATVRDEEPDLYRAWFDTLEAGVPERGELEVRASEQAHVHYLEDYCNAAFAHAAMKVCGRLLTLRFQCAQPGAAAPPIPKPPPVLTEMRLAADYTFDQFVVGPSNRLAHAACGAVCNQLGTLYNPLFVHGASGLGKTHLLQATCAEVRGRVPASQAVYVTCETFVNDFVQALADGQLHAFREQARALDLLVVDDVQFLANRESSQEELFHTFNVLYQSGKQIILSADSPPSEIPTLQDRLVSRFNWGLVTQIDPPNRETRQAILRKKAQLRGAEIPDEIIDLIAEQIESNIRLLEGALTKLISERQLGGRPMTIETARIALAGYGTRNHPPLRLSDILEAVCAHSGIRLQDLLGRRRTRSISQARQIAMYLARRLTPLSLEEIGMHFGGRDHSTVLHAHRAIELSRGNDRDLAAALTQLSNKLLGRS